MSEQASNVPRPILKSSTADKPERAVAPASGIVWDEDNLALNESEKVPRMTIDEPKTPYHAPGSPALSASNSPALAPTCSSTGSPAIAAATLAPAAAEGCFVGELPTLDAVTAVTVGSGDLEYRSACATAAGMPKLFTSTGKPVKSALKRARLAANTPAADSEHGGDINAGARVATEDTPPASDDSDDDGNDDDDDGEGDDIEGEEMDEFYGLTPAQREEAEAEKRAFELKRRAHYNMAGLLGRRVVDDDDDDDDGEDYLN